MDAREAAIELSKPSVRLAFDTNALFGELSFASACRDLHRLGLRAKNQIALFVSAAAHGEKLFDLKQDKQDQYDYSKVIESLEDLRLQIQDFTEKDATVLGERLGANFPTSQAWHQAKLRHYARSLGLGEEDIKGKSGQHLSATLDWLIAAHAHARDCILVTSDRGIEFKQVRRMKFAVLQEALRRLLATGSSSIAAPSNPEGVA